MYLPTLHDLATNVWVQTAHAHGPLVLLLAVWQASLRRDVLRAVSAGPAGGMLLFLGGLLVYVVGRSQSLLLLEAGSAPLVLGGMVWALHGGAALRAMATPLLMLLFLIPLPGFVLDGIMDPLREIAAHIAAVLFAGTRYAAAAPAAHAADGSLWLSPGMTGLDCLPGLAALGLLYIYLARPPALMRVTVLLASLLPVALLAAVAYTLALTLFVHYFGEAAGMAMDPGFSALLLLSVALVAWLGIDGLVQPRDESLQPGVA